MLEILICSSNRNEVRNLHSILKQLSDRMKIPISLKGYFNPSAKLPQISHNIYKPFDYDIVFLNLDDECICEFAKEIRRASRHTSIVISSGNIDTIKDNMILRPSMFYTDISCIESITKHLFSILKDIEKGANCFVIQNKDEIIRIPFDDILYFENDRRYIVLHTAVSRRTHTFVGKIDDLLEILPNSIFIKCHQSYVVNREKIKNINKITKQFIMISGDTVDISRRNYHDALQVFMSYGVTPITDKKDDKI